MHRRESGQAMAFWAVVMAAVVLPLASLAIDVTRAMYVRTHLQTAADAGCEAAAQYIDSMAFLYGGAVVIAPPGSAYDQFNAVVAEAGIKGYSPHLTSVSLDNAQNIVRCQADASVRAFIGITPPMAIRVEAMARTHTAPVP